MGTSLTRWGEAQNAEEWSGHSAGAPPGVAESAAVRAPLAGNARAPAAAREFVRTALGGWGAPAGTTDDVALLTSELVTNAVVHAGTDVRLECRHEGGTVTVEVADRHPTRAVETRGTGDPAVGTRDAHQGRGLRLVSALAAEWGVTYRRDGKTVWFRLRAEAGGEPPSRGADPSGRPASAPRPVTAYEADSAYGPDSAYEADSAYEPVSAYGPDSAYEPDSVPPERAGSHEPAEQDDDSLSGGLAHTAQRPAAGTHRHDPDWTKHGILSFLAEASDLLAGQTDEDRVASLACQLLVPRFADWCAVWLADADFRAPLRLSRVWHTQEERMDELRSELKETPPQLTGRTPPGRAVPWPWPGQASAYGPGGAAVGCRLFVGGRTVGTLVIGRAGLIRIPAEVVGIVEDFARRVAQAVLSARRYTRQATISRVLQRGLLPSGDVAVPGVETAVVYEPAGEGSWAGGDFYDFYEGTEGRWRFALGDVCGNGPEAAVVTGLARPVLHLLAREGHSVPEVMNRLNREVGEQTRFLSMVYGELVPRPASEGGGSHCTLVCAGHPLPLVRDTAGKVRAAAEPQLLLGIEEDVSYESQTVLLEPGETLLCVTDGVTERRSGRRQFDDEDGLAAVLADCGGLDAAQTAERVRRAVHGFGDDAADDLALLVLRAAER